MQQNDVQLCVEVLSPSENANDDQIIRKGNEEVGRLQRNDETNSKQVRDSDYLNTHIDAELDDM